MLVFDIQHAVTCSNVPSTVYAVFGGSVRRAADAKDFHATAGEDVRDSRGVRTQWRVVEGFVSGHLQSVCDREAHPQVQHDPQGLPPVLDQHVLHSGERSLFAAVAP